MSRSKVIHNTSAASGVWLMTTGVIPMYILNMLLPYISEASAILPKVPEKRTYFFQEDILNCGGKHLVSVQFGVVTAS